jgi:hypothetical protein
MNVNSVWKALWSLISHKTDLSHSSMLNSCQPCYSRDTGVGVCNSLGYNASHWRLLNHPHIVSITILVKYQEMKLQNLTFCTVWWLQVVGNCYIIWSGIRKESGNTKRRTENYQVGRFDNLFNTLTQGQIYGSGGHGVTQMCRLPQVTTDLYYDNFSYFS